MIVASVASRSLRANQRLDAGFFTSPARAALETIVLAEARGVEVVSLQDVSRLTAPARFRREWAQGVETATPYLQPYSIFEYVPEAAGALSVARSENLDDLLVPPEALLQSCSGRNLGPSVKADPVLTTFALSHDVVRIEVDDPLMRHYVLAFMNSQSGQLLLRRNRAGSVIDHLTLQSIGDFPIPVLECYHEVSRLAQSAADLLAKARTEMAELRSLVRAQFPTPIRRTPLRAGWSVARSALSDRLDVAWNDPVTHESARRLRECGGLEVAELAEVELPLRYRRHYVDAAHGRPVLSGRQILQAQPINLRYVSDRSFARVSDYALAAGMTLVSRSGRVEGGLGSPALVGGDREGWLASDDVIRIRPRDGVNPGCVYLGVAHPSAQVQIRAAAHGSVIDHIQPGDIAAAVVPDIPEDLADRALAAQQQFGLSSVLLRDAVDLLETGLVSAAHGTRT